MGVGAVPPALQTASELRAKLAAGGWHDSQGLAGRGCDGAPGTALLLRPDQHIAARWRGVRAQAIEQALARATGN